MGRWSIAGLALLAACSFNRSGGGGDRDDGGGSPDIDGGGDQDSDGAPTPDGGACTTGALDFTPDQWVEVSDDSLDLTNDFAVEAWARPREVSGEHHIVSRHDSAASEGYVLMIKDSLPEFRVYFADDQGPASHCDCTIEGEEVAVDQWVHLAGSFSDGTAYLFKDGALIETCDCAERCSGTCVGEVASYAGPMTIGIEASRRDRFGADGLIDDVHLRAGALTTSFEPRDAAACAGDTVLQFRFESPVGQELTSGCGAAVTGRLGSESGADLNDPTAVSAACPP